MAIRERHYRELEAAKKRVASEIVYILDLFDGKISLSDAMNTEIPFLDKLKECRIEAIDRSKQLTGK